MLKMAFCAFKIFSVHLKHCQVKILNPKLETQWFSLYFHAYIYNIDDNLDDGLDDAFEEDEVGVDKGMDEIELYF